MTAAPTASHLSLDDMARLLDVAGDDVAALAGDERDQVHALRAHLRGCTACTVALAREASLEEDALAVAAELVFCPGCSRPHARADDVRGPARCAFCGVAFAPGGLHVEQVLSESDHGRLYLARGPEGPVALKEIVFARVPDVEALERFEREARLLQQLRHERIPRYLTSFSEGEGVHLRLYLAQRYVDGPALLEQLEVRRFTEGEVRAMAREVLAILVALQGLSPPVIHRDVKPANLVRGPDGALCLVDFGSARDVAKTTGGTLVGTFGYMPMEQLSGVVDESTDVYALGATMVHLLTRRPPWETLQDEALPASLTASPALRSFLARCVAPRDRRFPNARAALVALDGLPQADARRRRRPWVLGAAALVIVAVGAAGAPAALQAMRAPRGLPPAEAPLVEAPPVPPQRQDGRAQAREQLIDSHATIDAHIAMHLGDIVGCGRRSSFTGDVEATWAVAPTGMVEGLSVRGSDARLVSCLTGAIKAWRFPARAGGVAVDVARTFNFGAGAAVKQAASDDRKLTIELQDADIRNVIRLIGDVAERDVVFGDDVHGKVTTKFVNTPWERALDHILQTHDLVVEDGDGVLRVEKRR
ncbi:MAG: protein kinase [Deltaproteobacteria bacterium]|nr:protein kinase [Deltaproteobacteria bacterium]